MERITRTEEFGLTSLFNGFEMTGLGERVGYRQGLNRPALYREYKIDLLDGG